jgi:hypothetical protein
MPTPPSEPASPSTGRTVCDCGYDLTGLPAAADTRCPECGAVVAQLRLSKPWLRRWWVLMIVVMAPSVMWFALLFFDRVRVWLPVPNSAAYALYVLTGLWLLAASCPASVRLTLGPVDTRSDDPRVGLCIFAIAGCVLANIAVFAMAASFTE